MVIVLKFLVYLGMNLLESRLPMERLQALLSERFQIVFRYQFVRYSSYAPSYANGHRLLKFHITNAWNF